MSALTPPQSTACSPKRSVSVSSVKVVSSTPARVQPMPRAYESANALALPLASCSIASSPGVPPPSVNTSRTRCPGAFGLLDRQQSGGTAALREHFADAMPGSFRRHHGYVNGRGGIDGAEANVETVSKHQRLARLKIWRNGFVIKFLLLGIGHEDHDDIGPCGGIRGRLDGETVFFRFGPRGARFRQTHADVAAAVAQIQRVRVALRTVTEYGDLFRLNKREVCVLIVIELCHVVPFMCRARPECQEI